MRNPNRAADLPVAAGVADWRDHLGRPWPGALQSPAVARSPDVMPAALAAALSAGHSAQIAAEVLDWQARGGRIDVLLRSLARWLGHRPGGILDPAWLALADCTRAVAGFDEARAAVPLAIAAVLAGARMAGSAELPAPVPAGHPADLASVQSAVAARQGDRAEALVARAMLDDVASTEIEGWLLQLACAHPGDGGVTAIAALRFTELRAAVGESGIVDLLPRLARALAERPERLACTRAHGERLVRICAQLPAMTAAADPDKARFFQEPKFRPHVLDGKGDAPLRAAVKALEFGVPRELLAGSLTLAAAERLLRFDPRLDADESVVEGWPDALHLLVLTSAVRQLAVVVAADDWIALYLYAVAQVHAGAALDAAQRDRFLLPDPEAVQQTWDHGPEIAKIVAHVHAGRAERAVAMLRAYFLMVLPDQPLCRQLLEAAMADGQGPAWAQALAIAAMSSAIAEFQALGGHPHRELPLCAAVWALATWRSGGTTWQTVAAAQAFRESGQGPRRLIGTGFAATT